MTSSRSFLPSVSPSDPAVPLRAGRARSLVAPMIALGLATTWGLAACSTHSPEPPTPATSVPSPSSAPETTVEGVTDPGESVGSVAATAGGGAAAAAIGAVQRLLGEVAAPTTSVVPAD